MLNIRIIIMTTCYLTYYYYSNDRTAFAVEINTKNKWKKNRKKCQIIEIINIFHSCYFDINYLKLKLTIKMEMSLLHGFKEFINK